MKKKTVITLLVIVLLLVATFGMSVAYFSYGKNSIIESSVSAGDITFKYTEDSKKGREISLEDATPISDNEGKRLDNYFDFTIEADLIHSDMLYEVEIEEISGSTIPLSGVKVYITELDNNLEKDIQSNYDINGKVKKISDYNNGVIYQERILKNTKNYEKHFRVRIWIDEDIDIYTDNYINTTGLFRINVNARSNSSMVDASIPTPVITGGTGDVWVSSAQTIKLVESNPVIGGVDHYEYYVTDDSEDIPDEDTIATGTTNNEIIVDLGGTSYIFYRIISSAGTKSNWSNSQIVKINDSDEDWEKFLRAGGYGWYNYSSLENAMSDTEVTDVIFDNSNAMTYLVGNEGLLMDIKNLDNYHSTIAPKMLNSSLYTDIQKYNYGLPFYLYNQGTYDSNLFTIRKSSSTAYSLGYSFSYENAGSYMSFVSTQYPNGCTNVVGESGVALNVNKYVSIYSNVTYRNLNVSNYSNMSTVIGMSTKIGTTSNGPNYYSSQILSAGVYSADIKNVTGSLYPSMWHSSCDSYSNSNGYLNYRITVYYDKLWME